eukprot:6472052-Amphidinium_carterae.1
MGQKQTTINNFIQYSQKKGGHYTTGATNSEGDQWLDRDDEVSKGTCLTARTCPTTRQHQGTSRQMTSIQILPKKGRCLEVKGKVLHANKY